MKPTIKDMNFTCNKGERIAIVGYNGAGKTNIGAYALNQTKWLNEEKKKSPLVIINSILMDGTACKGKVEIPETVTSIADYALKNELVQEQS